MARADAAAALAGLVAAPALGVPPAAAAGIGDRAAGETRALSVARAAAAGLGLRLGLDPRMDWLGLGLEGLGLDCNAMGGERADAEAGAGLVGEGEAAAFTGTFGGRI